jgi:hypothetical protein
VLTWKRSHGQLPRSRLRDNVDQPRRIYTRARPPQTPVTCESLELGVSHHAASACLDSRNRLRRFLYSPGRVVPHGNAALIFCRAVQSATAAEKVPIGFALNQVVAGFKNLDWHSILH